MRNAPARALKWKFMLETIQWTPEGVVMIDQRRLPREEVFVTCTTYQQVAEAIRNMTIRGAPAIGVAAAMRVARRHAADRRESFLGHRPHAPRAQRQRPAPDR